MKRLNKDDKSSSRSSLLLRHKSPSQRSLIQVHNQEYNTIASSDRDNNQHENEIESSIVSSGVYTGSIDAYLMIPHGQGQIQFNDGSIYKGSWCEGRWNGYGQYYCTKSNAWYQGNFLDNQEHGLMVVSYDDGRLYDGIFSFNRMGKGKMIYPTANKTKTKNNHQNDATGTSFSNTGIYYWGYFDGKERPHERGKLVFEDGREYDGEFYSGIIEGHGRMTYKKGFDDIDNSYSFYLGSFCEGKRCGLGVLMIDEVIVHDGLWYNDEPIHENIIPLLSSSDCHQYNGVVSGGHHKQRLLGRIPKTISPYSRMTKKKHANKNKKKKKRHHHGQQKNIAT